MNALWTTAVAASAALLVHAPAAFGQASGPAADAPRAVAVGGGDTVQVVGRAGMDHAPMARRVVRRLDYLITTRIPANDAAGRRAQADRAAAALGPEARELGYRVLSIGFCDTRACALGRSPPSTWFLYELGANGWRRVAAR